jgi:hypothetical protein
MTEFEAQVLADLSVLKSQMKDLLGNGQPGRVAQIESRLLDHERAVQRLKGMAAAFAAMLTIVHTATDLLLRHRA